MQHPSPSARADASTWWRHARLDGGDDGLTIAGRSVAELARQHGTPLYIYDGHRIRERIASMRDAFAARGLRSRILYAMKANRHRAVLALIRAEGDVGIDACSPREVALALEAGFAASEISVTASSLTTRDLQSFAWVGCHLNLDTVSAIVRYGSIAPRGSSIGLRLDTGVTAGYGINAKTAYSAGKLGLDARDLEGALAAADAAGLRIDTLHTHLGWGLRTADEACLHEAFAIVADVARGVPTVETINVGGGLGGRLVGRDSPLGLGAWAHAIAKHFGAMNVTVACEPGTYLVADAGLLVAEVGSLWTKNGARWAGIDASQSVNVYRAYYDLPHEIIHVGRPFATPTDCYAIAGNVNESGDVFSRGCELPELVEGDLLALYPAGAYGASMASDHCLRGDFREILL